MSCLVCTRSPGSCGIHNTAHGGEYLVVAPNPTWLPAPPTAPGWYWRARWMPHSGAWRRDAVEVTHPRLLAVRHGFLWLHEPVAEPALPEGRP